MIEKRSGVVVVVDSWLQLLDDMDGVVAVVGIKLISMNYNLCYQCLSIVFDFKRRLVWQPVGYQLATTRRLVAIVWQLVAN